MNERRVCMIVYGLIALCILLMITAGCVSARPKIFYTASCDNGAELQVVRIKEMVELAFQDRFNLFYKRQGEKALQLTGNVGILPRAPRYIKMLYMADFNPGKTQSMFTIHYVDPALLSKEEFDAVVAVYRNHRNSWHEIKGKIDILIYGSQDMFHEIFTCENGLFVYTDLMGNVNITDNASREADSLPREKRHVNNVGYFDADNVFYPRKGKIVSGVVQDLFGKPSKKVLFKGNKGEEDYTGHVETLWVDLLYNDKETGINGDLFYGAKGKDGKRFDKVFTVTREIN